MFFSSLSSCSTRVSNEIGAGQPQAAKRATRVVMYMALSEGLVISFTMFLLRNVWGYMYSNEQEVVTYIARMLPILGISFFIDGLHSSLSGRIKMHCTWQKSESQLHNHLISKLSCTSFLRVKMSCSCTLQACSRVVASRKLVQPWTSGHSTL